MPNLSLSTTETCVGWPGSALTVPSVSVMAVGLEAGSPGTNRVSCGVVTAPPVTLTWRQPVSWAL